MIHPAVSLNPFSWGFIGRHIYRASAYNRMFQTDRRVRHFGSTPTVTFFLKKGKTLKKNGRTDYENILISNDMTGDLYQYVLPADPKAASMNKINGDSEKILADYQEVRTYRIRREMPYADAIADPYFRNENHPTEMARTRTLWYMRRQETREREKAVKETKEKKKS